jgi:C1A family cysteine protease
MKNIGYKENDGRTNAEFRDLLQKQPISVGIKTTNYLNHYHDGVLTEKYLRCSNADDEVNHGVLLVGYGHIGDSSGSDGGVSKGRCTDYWIVRNSWGSSWG